MTKRPFYMAVALLLAVALFLVMAFAVFCCIRASKGVEQAVGAVFEQDPDAAEKLLLALLEQRKGDGRTAAWKLGLTERTWSFYPRMLFPLGAILPWIALLLLILAAGSVLFILQFRARQREQTDLAQRVEAAVSGDEPFRPHSDEERLYTALAEELERTRALSEAKSAELRTYIENVSHEIKTPAAGIVLTLDLMEESGATPERIERLRDCVSRIQSYVGELLTLARIRSGRLHFSRERVEIDELIGTVLRSFPDAKTDKIDPSLAICGDRKRLFEAVSNLIRNAIRYGSDEKTVWISAEPLGESVRIRISGSGEGELPRLERYAVGREDGTSTGIGLSIAQETAVRHNGRLCFSARVDGGLNADLILPIFHLKSGVL